MERQGTEVVVTNGAVEKIEECTQLECSGLPPVVKESISGKQGNEADQSDGRKKKGHKTQWRPVEVNITINGSGRNSRGENRRSRGQGRRGKPTSRNYSGDQHVHPYGMDTQQNGYAAYIPYCAGCALGMEPGEPRPHVLSCPRLPLKDSIRLQIEYYFSEENLAGDSRLKGIMDPKGYVAIEEIATFPRMKLVSEALILEALKQSSKVEVEDKKVRTTKDPEKWPLCNSKLNPGAEAFMPRECFLRKSIGMQENIQKAMFKDDGGCSK